MNQRSPSASTVEFFNNIRQERPFHNRSLREAISLKIPLTDETGTVLLTGIVAESWLSPKALGGFLVRATLPTSKRG